MTAFESYSSRPMSVDFPSSTDPAVAMRSIVIDRAIRIVCSSRSRSSELSVSSRNRSSELSVSSRKRSSELSVSSRKRSSEVALTLAVFHAGLGDPVVGAGGATLGEPRHRGLRDHLRHRAREGLHAPGAGDVADGAEPHGFLDAGFVLARLQ